MAKTKDNYQGAMKILLPTTLFFYLLIYSIININRAKWCSRIVVKLAAWLYSNRFVSYLKHFKNITTGIMSKRETQFG